MNSTPNEWKSVFAERFIRTWKKIYKLKTGVSKNFYFKLLDDTVDKFNTICYIYHRRIKTKAVVVKSDPFAEYNE